MFTLNNDSFKETLTEDDIVLGGCFTGLNVNSVILDISNPSKATLTLSGYLKYDTGVGSITVSESGVMEGIDRVVHVLVVKPIGYLLAQPNPKENVVPGSHVTYDFVLTVENNSFSNSFSVSDIELGEDFTGFTVVSAEIDDEHPDYNPLEPKYATITISGTLPYSLQGVGTITVKESGFITGSDLTASIIVENGDEESNKFTLSLDAKHGKGNVTVTPDKAYYDSGETVVINATGYNDWDFYKWEIRDFPDSTSLPLQLTMNRNYAVTAHFRLPLEKIKGGNYVRFGGQTYLKLTGTNSRRVMKVELGGQSTWSDSIARPTREELKNDDWNDSLRKASAPYWTRDQQNKNKCYYIDIDGKVKEKRETTSLRVREALTLSTGLYAYSGDGLTVETAYVLDY